MRLHHNAHHMYTQTSWETKCLAEVMVELRSDQLMTQQKLSWLKSKAGNENRSTLDSRHFQDIYNVTAIVSRTTSACLVKRVLIELPVIVTGNAGGHSQVKQRIWLCQLWPKQLIWSAYMCILTHWHALYNIHLYLTYNHSNPLTYHIVNSLLLNSYILSPRDLCDLETQGPEAVASRA